MCKIISVSNNKGGVAKTATTINLAAGLVRCGKRVACVDLDPQSQTTIGFGYEKNLQSTIKTMMENVIMGTTFDAREAIVATAEGVDLIPANKLLAGLDMSLVTVEDGKQVLREYLRLIQDDYDYIIIDTQPSLGMLTINALCAANSVLIPVQPQFYAADGLMELLRVIQNIKKRDNPELSVEGILFTIDSCRYNNSKRNKEAVINAYGQDMNIFNVVIPRSESIAETASEGVSIFTYDSKGKGAVSYQALAKEVIAHEKAK